MECCDDLTQPAIFDGVGLQQCWNPKMSVSCLALNQKRCFARHTLTATSTMELRLPPSRLLLVASLVACHRVRHRLRNDDRTAWESGRVSGGGGNVGSLLWAAPAPCCTCVLCVEPRCVLDSRGVCPGVVASLSNAVLWCGELPTASSGSKNAPPVCGVRDRARKVGYEARSHLAYGPLQL